MMNCKYSNYKNLLCIVVLLCISLSIAESRRKHKCIHDQITKNAKLTRIDDLNDARLLQSTGFGPIRMHYVYNETDVQESDPKGQNTIKIMEIIRSFWAKVIEVDYLPALSFNVDASQDRDSFACLTFQVPRSLLDNPVPNKDFGILVESQEDGDTGITAYSYPCAYSAAQNKPLWGIVHWNKQYMSFDPLSFQENIHIGIHEIIHIMGFSQLLYQFFETGTMTSFGRGNYMTGPFINEEVTRQYACQDPPGMLLENSGGSGTALSHWSRKTAVNELMTAGVSPNNPTISYITLALLEETGWYRRIYKTYAKFINFGYRKGCSMLEPTNCTSNEYCHQLDVKSCDYDRTALGFCKNDSLSDCLFTKYYINFICIDPNYSTKSLHADIIATTGERGGKRSRCFDSDLHTTGSDPSKFPYRCYDVICSSTRKTLTIRVGNTFGFCMFPGQTITIIGYEGTLTCPPSFQAVCAVERCPNQCNANGICLNGKCLCGQNYSGEACQELSSVGFSSKTNLFLPQDNNNCLLGSYRTIFGDCELCQFEKCAKCTASECLICMDESLPRNGRCT